MATPEIPSVEKPAITTTPESVDLGPQATEAGVEIVPETPSSGPAPANPQQPVDPATQVIPVPAPASPTGPSITLPNDPTTLTTMSKGDTNSSVTWLAVYWLRMMKKALKKHWNVIVGGDNSSV